MSDAEVLQLAASGKCDQEDIEAPSAAAPSQPVHKPLLQPPNFAGTAIKHHPAHPKHLPARGDSSKESHRQSRASTLDSRKSDLDISSSIVALSSTTVGMLTKASATPLSA